MQLIAVRKHFVASLIALAVSFSASASGEASENLVKAALERTNHVVIYDGAYIALDYPGGDVPANIGVCTDLVIRAYRNGLNLDLQRLVHEDIAANFHAYPSKRLWGLSRPDRNIDHRRVPNLQVFFKRHGEDLTISASPRDYSAGDLVTWLLPGNLPHIGIVSNRISKRSGNPLIVHNIGAGPKLDDMLFHYPITGHYRYIPQPSRSESMMNVEAPTHQ